jgi:diaminopimelate epimerase
LQKKDAAALENAAAVSVGNPHCVLFVKDARHLKVVVEVLLQRAWET